MLPAALVLLLIVPANLSSTLLQSTDLSRWEGWVSTVEVRGLPEGARASLVDALGDELSGSAVNSTGGRAVLPLVSRFPGVLRLAVNGTPTNETLLLNGSYSPDRVRFFDSGGSLFAQICVDTVRNSAGAVIPNSPRTGIPVLIGRAGARTDSDGCALLPAPRERAATSVGGFPASDVPAPAAADGLLFSYVEAGGQASQFFERGFLRAVRLSAAADLRNFTLVVESRADNSLLFTSRSNVSGVARVLLVVEGPGTPYFTRPGEAGEGSPLPALSLEARILVPLPGFGIVRMVNTTGGQTFHTVIVILIGISLSGAILFASRRRLSR